MSDNLADRVLAALWKMTWEHDPIVGHEWCNLCGGHAPDKLAVAHSPGCVLRDVPAETLAALEAWEHAGEPG